MIAMVGREARGIVHRLPFLITALVSGPNSSSNCGPSFNNSRWKRISRRVFSSRLIDPGTIPKSTARPW